jgi:hypothetical protein
MGNRVRKDMFSFFGLMLWNHYVDQEDEEPRTHSKIEPPEVMTLIHKCILLLALKLSEGRLSLPSHSILHMSYK